MAAARRRRAARRWCWQQVGGGCSAAAAAEARRQRSGGGGGGGGGISTPAASLVAAAAAWRQRGISGSSTINNQLKALAATALETATMTAMTTTIKTKATAVAWHVEIDRDLSLKHVGPLSLARLYGEFCMVSYSFSVLCMSKNNEGDSLAESIFPLFQMGESIFR
jgi:hypothetical protein